MVTSVYVCQIRPTGIVCGNSNLEPSIVIFTEEFPLTQTQKLQLEISNAKIETQITQTGTDSGALPHTPPEELATLPERMKKTQKVKHLRYWPIE